ncbi:MAG: hypothetical protein ACK2T0_15725 [Anaerolineales bacterium]
MSSKRVSAIVLVIAAILVAAATISLTGAKATRPSDGLAVNQPESKFDAPAMDSWDYFLRHGARVEAPYLRPVVALTSDIAVRPSVTKIDASAMDSWDYFLRHGARVGAQYLRPVVALTGELAPRYMKPIVTLTGDTAAGPTESMIGTPNMESWDYFLRHSGPVGIQYMRPVVTLTGDLGPSYLEPIVTLTSDSALGHR